MSHWTFPSLLIPRSAVPKEFVASASNSGGGSTFTINKPTGVQAGNFMVAIIWGDALAAASLAGWVLEPGSDLAFAGLRFAVLTRVADGSEGTSFGFSTTNVVKMGHILAYRGVSAVDVIGVRGASGSGTVMTAPSVTSSEEGVLIGSFCAQSAGRTVGTPPPGMSAVSANNVNMSGYVYEQNPSATGATGTKAVTFSGTSTSKAAFLMQIY